MTTKLFINRTCPYAQRAEIVAVYKGFKGPIIPVGLRAEMPEWYKKDINPREEVPALQLPDGKCFAESAFIAQYLDESIEPRYELYPAHADLRRKILDFTSVSQQFISSGFGSLTAVGDEEIDAANNKIRVAIRSVERAMSTTSAFAVGDSFSYADVFLIPFVLRSSVYLQAFSNFNMAKESPRLQRYIDACLTIPAVAKTTPSPEIFVRAFGEWASGKKAKWNFHLYFNKVCPYCERVVLTIAQITRNDTDETKGNTLGEFFSSESIGLGADMSPMYKEYVNPDEEVPVLRLPTGERLTSSLNTVQFLAERFGYEVANSHGAVKGLIPLSAPDANGHVHVSAEQLLEGRFFVDSLMRVVSELGGAIYRRDRDVKVEGDVAYELKNAERVFAAAGPHGKAYLFSDSPSYFDFLVLPFLHRLELLMGERLSEHAPSLVKAVAAVRKDPVLSKCLAPAEEYLKK